MVRTELCVCINPMGGGCLIYAACGPFGYDSFIHSFDDQDAYSDCIILHFRRMTVSMSSILMISR